jgi:Sulfotransferase domain
MSLPPHTADIFRTMSGWFMKDTFADCTDRACAISSYRRNSEEVRDTIPAERLLVFNVAEGWEPLCRFLEAPEPATPFPRSHPRDEFWAHFGGEPA